MTNTLITTKDDIKNAITSHESGFITGGMITYADSIRNLKTIKFNLSNVVPIGLKFSGSYASDFSMYDFSNITDGSGMFSGTGWTFDFPLDPKWYKADNIVLNDTCKNFIDCAGIFSGSVYVNLETDLFENATNCSDMCAGSGCKTAKFNLPKATNLSGMFQNCSGLTYAKLDAPLTTNLHATFSNCDSLVMVELNCNGSNINSVAAMFANCSSLQSFFGIENLGAVNDLIIDGFIRDCSKLTRGSVKNIFEKLYNRASAGYSVLTIKLNADVITKLSEEDIAIATNKGWIIS